MIIDALRREMNRREKTPTEALSLGGFIERVTPAFSNPKHLSPLVEAFDRVERGPVRMCVSVPPRHGKTETVLHGIARYLLRNPDRTVAYVSYAAAIARSKSRQIRDYALRAGVELRNDAASMTEWRTKQGGGVLAAGVGGPLTGHGVSLLVVDDPHKNRQDADSAQLRERVFGWFTSTAMTRIEPGGSALVVHTRWHPQDLIGRLSDDEEVDWELLTMRAIDASGRALWPERWPVSELEKRRDEVGEYDWDSLYQQNPRARKGLVFPEFDVTKHVVPHRELEAMLRVGGRWSVRPVCGIDWGWSDPSAWLVVARTSTGRLVVLDELYESNVLVDEGGWLQRAVSLENGYRIEAFVADPSEPGYIAALRKHLRGRVLVYNANNDISEGIRRIRTKMQRDHDGPLLLVSDRCMNLIRELGSYSYRASSDGAPSETPEDRNNHAIDALRYAVMRLEQ